MLGIRTELLIVPFPVASCGMEGREVEHDGPFRPVYAIGGIVRYLTQEVIVCLAKFNVDAAAVGRRHCGLGSAFVVKRVLVLIQRSSHSPF